MGLFGCRSAARPHGADAKWLQRPVIDAAVVVATLRSREPTASSGAGGARGGGRLHEENTIGALSAESSERLKAARRRVSWTGSAEPSKWAGRIAQAAPAHGLRRHGNAHAHRGRARGALAPPHAPKATPTIDSGGHAAPPEKKWMPAPPPWRPRSLKVVWSKATFCRIQAVPSGQPAAKACADHHICASLP